MSFTSPYSSQAIVSYNSSPPPDDGSQTVANQITWDKSKTKLADPIKTLAEAINTANVAAFAKTINTSDDVNNTVAGSIRYTSSELTLAGGVATGTRAHHTFTPAGGATATTVTRLGIGNYGAGELVWLRAATGKTIYISSTGTATDAFAHPCLLDENYPIPFMYTNAGWRIAQAGWIKLDEVSGGGASYDFLKGIGSAYDSYMLEFANVVPTSATGPGLWARVSVDGSTFLSGATDYAYNQGSFTVTVAGISAANTATDTKLLLSGGNVGSDVSGVLNFWNPSATVAHWTDSRIHYIANGGSYENYISRGVYWGSATVMRGIQVLMSTNNIASGAIRLYGLRK